MTDLTPDCQFSATLTAPGASPAIQNEASPCVAWRVSYYAAGLSALSLQLEGAPDNGNGAPGTWVPFPTTAVIDGSNPLTDLSEGTLSVQGVYYPWIRLNATAFTGPGTLQARVYGYKDSFFRPAGLSPVPPGVQAIFNTNLVLGNNLTISGYTAWTTLPSDAFAGLNALLNLALNNNTLTALPAGVFDNLTALQLLILTNNALTALPAGVFDNLTALQGLGMDNNALTALPAGVFDNLTALQALILTNNALTALPAGVFDNLTALQDLEIDNNALTALPAGVFDNLTALQGLILNNNALTALPAGVFDNLTALQGLILTNNALTVSAVNQLLAELVATVGSRVICNLDISGGTNAAPTGQGILDAATLVAAGWTVTTNTVSLPITGVNQLTQTFTVAGDQTAYFPSASGFTVAGSTGNDGVYTVVSATLNAGNTDIITVMPIPNAVADGAITAI